MASSGGGERRHLAGEVGESVGMADRMSVGQILKARREERALTPEEAARHSRVPIRLLQALEADDYRLVPDVAYLIRPLHDYARLLELETEELEREFRKAIRRPTPALLAVIPARPSHPTIRWAHVLWTVVAILIVAPLVFIALSLASKRAAERFVPLPASSHPVEQHASGGGEGPEDVDRLAIGGPESIDQDDPPEIEGDLGAFRPIRDGETPAAAPVDPTSPRFLLTAHAAEQTWMAVRADGGEARQVLLQKGESARFVAEEGFLVTLGNAGGVILALNGDPMPPLGKSGQVIRNLAIPIIRKGAEGPTTGLSGTGPTGPGRSGP